MFRSLSATNDNEMKRLLVHYMFLTSDKTQDWLKLWTLAGGQRRHKHTDLKCVIQPVCGFWRAGLWSVKAHLAALASTSKSSVSVDPFTSCWSTSEELRRSHNTDWSNRTDLPAASLTLLLSSLDRTWTSVSCCFRVTLRFLTHSFEMSSHQLWITSLCVHSSVQ